MMASSCKGVVFKAECILKAVIGLFFRVHFNVEVTVWLQSIKKAHIVGVTIVILDIASHSITRILCKRM